MCWQSQRGEKCPTATWKMRLIYTHGAYQIKRYQLGANLKIDSIRSVFREEVITRAADPSERTATLINMHITALIRIVL